MSNTYTDQTTSAPILNFYTEESQLTSQVNPSVTELHMIPAGGVSLPSGRYIDFTAPATGNTYTAPADGWVVYRRAANANSQYIQMLEFSSSSDLECGMFSMGQNGNTPTVYVPVKAGDSVRFDYTVAGTTTICRFIYANGTPNVSAS